MNIHVPSLIKGFKAAFFKGIKDKKTISSLGLANLVCGFATNDIIKSQKEFHYLSLSRINLIYNLFPKKIFQSIRSPQYMPYATIAKLILDSHKNFELKPLIQTIYGLSSIKYMNSEFFEVIFGYLQDKIKVNSLVYLILGN